MMRKTKSVLKTTTFLMTLFAAAAVSTNALAQSNYEYTSQPNLAQIGVGPSLHESVTSAGNPLTGTGVGIAIFDGLAASNQSDLAGKLVIPDPPLYSGSYNYADGHGTHVAGIAGAAKNDSGVVGVAPGVTVYSIPVFDDSGWVAYDKGAKAFNYLLSQNASGANIKAVNMSYGPSTKGDVFLSGELNLFSQYKDDFVLVRAAGNSGANAKYEYFNGVASTELSHVLIVGSVSGSNSLSSFSNKPGEACIGPSSTCTESEKAKQFWMVAPGQGILSSLPSGWGKKSGTSMAAPHITGAVALVWQQGYDNNVNLSPSDVASILKRSATDLGATGVDGAYGWGLLNVQAALQPVGDISVPIGETVDDTAPVDDSTDDSTTTTKPKKERGGGKGNGGGKGQFKSRSLLSGMIVLDEFKRPFEVEDWAVATRESVASGDHIGRMSSAVFSRQVAQIDTEDYFIAAWTSTDNAIAPASSFHFASPSLTLDVAAGTPAVYFSPTQSVVRSAGEPERLDSLMFAAMGEVGHLFDRALSFHATTPLSPEWEVSSFVLQSMERKAYLPGLAAPVPYYEGEERAHFAGVSFDRQLGSLGSLGMIYTALYEKGTLLGQYDEGLFGFGENGLTQNIGLRFSTPLTEAVSLSGFYSQAIINGLGSNPSLFERAQWSGNQFGLSARVTDVGIEDSQLSVSLIKPLEVTGGQIAARVPVGREFDGQIIYAYRSVEIEQDGAPVSLQLDYLAPFGPLKSMFSLDLANAPASSNGQFRIGVMAGLLHTF